jgi:predicted dehydrogenase
MASVPARQSVWAGAGRRRAAGWMSGPGNKNKMSRRALLKAAPVLAAAPYVLAASALRKGASTTPPSDRVTLGLIGCGRSGVNWIENYYRLRQFQVVSFCDVDDARREHVRSRIERRESGTKSVRDFREALADESIDAVVIATPDHWHAVMACEAARANKDIYCESPISLTVREARQIAQVSGRYGRIFQAAMGHRYYSSYRRGCDLVRGGALGKIQKIHVPLGSPSQYCALGASSTGCPQGFDWDLWLGPAPPAPYHPNRCLSSYDGWRSYREYSGGSLAYYGAGSLDLVQWVLDADTTGPVEFVPPRQEGDKSIPLTIRYADGTTVIAARGPHEGTVEFVGENGSLAFGVGDRGFTTWPDSLAGGPRARGPEKRKVSEDAITDFRDCVRTRSRPLADAESACRSVTVAHLACIAWWTGRTIKWDPAKEAIIGDPYAARLLDRPKRMPWRC